MNHFNIIGIRPLMPSVGDGNPIYADKYILSRDKMYSSKHVIIYKIV